MTPYDKLMARKRKWTPVKPVAGICKEGAEETIHRALALRHMELPVGDFINDALSTDVPSKAREILVSNVRDEENHDLALGYIADAYGIDEKAEAEAMASFGTHGLHILITQYSKPWLLSVQFSSYCCPSLDLTVTRLMRTTSADISRDEQIHVATNSLVCSELGLSISPSLDKLRKATINWVMQPLSNTNPDQFLTKNFWTKSSDNLMYNGNAPELFATRRQMPAF